MLVHQPLALPKILLRYPNNCTTLFENIHMFICRYMWAPNVADTSIVQVSQQKSEKSEEILMKLGALRVLFLWRCCLFPQNSLFLFLTFYLQHSTNSVVAVAAALAVSDSVVMLVWADMFAQVHLATSRSERDTQLQTRSFIYLHFSIFFIFSIFFLSFFRETKANEVAVLHVVVAADDKCGSEKT